MKICTTCGNTLDNEKYERCYDCWFFFEYGEYIEDYIREIFFSEKGDLFYIYLLECEDNNKNIVYYCGYTSRHPKFRLKEHITNKNKKHYTARLNSIKLVYFEKFPDKHSAIMREKEIKNLGGTYKRGLIHGMKNSIVMENIN